VICIADNMIHNIIEPVVSVVMPHRCAKHKMRPIAVDVVWSVCLSVCLSHCLSVGLKHEPYKNG